MFFKNSKKVEMIDREEVLMKNEERLYRFERNY